MRTKKTTPVQILILLSAILSGACNSAQESIRVHKSENYKFDKNISIAHRTSAAPDFLLEYLKKLDSQPDYQVYMPSPGEMKIIKNAFSLLPEVVKAMLQQRLIGTYFIRNFKGNGLCDWVLDQSGTVYVYFVFNPASLGKIMSDLLTEKEKTCFIKNDPSIKIFIDCGQKVAGFYYILMHESAHAVDYVRGVTPYVDRESRDSMKIMISETNFTKDIWDGYYTSKQHFIFSKKVFFYNFGAPKLEVSGAADVYKELARSPFASLYGSISWAEDFADLWAFYHITSVMGAPYEISVLRDNKKIFSLRPMKSPPVVKRLPMIKALYSEKL